MTSRKVGEAESASVEYMVGIFVWDAASQSIEQQQLADSKYKFTGKERDTETSLDYFGARYYDSWNGRWLSVDPMAEKYPGWSPYCYSLSNPIVYYDPNGKWVYVANLSAGLYGWLNTNSVATAWGFPSLKSYAGTFYMRPDNYDFNLVQNQLNGLVNEWSDPNGQHYAPRIADFLKNTSIALALVGGGLATTLGYGGITNPRNAHIALADELFGAANPYGGPDAEFMHELVHAMLGTGATEFQAYGAMLSAGYASQDYMTKIMQDPKANFFAGMPDEFKQYFDKDNNLMPEKVDDFWKAYSDYSKTITGQGK